jgi:hypothetical protein
MDDDTPITGRESLLGKLQELQRKIEAGELTVSDAMIRTLEDWMGAVEEAHRRRTQG